MAFHKNKTCAFSRYLKEFEQLCQQEYPEFGCPLFDIMRLPLSANRVLMTYTFAKLQSGPSSLLNNVQYNFSF